EFAPPHFHVAVFPSRYATYVASQTTAGEKHLAGIDATATYRVRAGDTLWDIAQLHGTTVDAIVTLNGIDDDDPLQPGQELIIPRNR
ncbi:MAG TPA: LysM domain-containing protein, partial [Gemmatimonadaceae bacterium]